MEKDTKGKQKIEMKEVEDYGDRLITFSKRKLGILKKMNELITSCDVDVAFLAFAQSGKPYTFAHPSMEEVVGRIKNPVGHEPTAAKDGIDTGPLVEAFKRHKINDIMEKYADLKEEFKKVEEEENKLEESKSEKKLDKMWWNILVESSNMEDLKLMHLKYEELCESLGGIMSLQQLGRDGDGSSSGLAGRGHCGGG